MMPETAEELSQQPEVRKELARATGRKAEAKVKTGDEGQILVCHARALLLGCAVLYFLVGSKLIPLSQAASRSGPSFIRGSALIVVVLAIAKAIRVYAIGRIEDAVTRFTLQRIRHLVVGMLIALIAISFFL